MKEDPTIMGRENAQPSTADQTRHVKSADRALDVMEMLVHAPHGLKHSELASSRGIPKSSLTKILASLMASGYVRRVDGSTYLVGERWRALVKASITGTSIDGLVEPSLRRLVDATGETAGFNMVVNEQIETISTIVSARQLQFTMIVGERAPLHRMSSGFVILANMRPEFQDRYYAAVAPGDSILPLLGRTGFQHAMREIRTHGFAEMRGFREGIAGLGVALLSQDGQPLASLNVAMPESRLTTDSSARAIAALKTVAADLGQRLDGWIDPVEEWLPRARSTNSD